jgi:hypothetical protein
MRYNHGHSAILSNLEPLILAGLESKHRAIVNEAIRLWNATFADCTEHLEYTPKIKAALLRLRPVADLQLPFFQETIESEASEEHRQLLTLAETQDNSIDFFEPSRLDSILGKQSVTHPDSSRDQKSGETRGVSPLLGVNKRSREETPEMGFRKTKKRVPTPKLRHEDSQIQFEAIDSSPIVDEIMESQLLTDRQKEVNERQKLDAAMFPDLRSSPRTKGTPSTPELPLHRSASKTRSLASPTIARQTTPTFILQAEEDDFINSSPTPTRANTSEPPSSPPEAATKHRVATYDEELDIPSSPPEVIEDFSNVNTTPLYPSAQIDPYAVETTRTISTYEETPDASAELKTSSTSEMPAPTRSLTRRSAADSVSKHSQISIDTSVAVATDMQEGADDSASAQNTRTTPVFHDALTSPVSSEGHTANNEVFEDAVSFPHTDPQKPTAKKPSSSISDFDESSMLRLLKEYDQGSGRPRRSVRFSAEKEKRLAAELESVDSPCPAKPSDSLVDSSKDNRAEPVATSRDKKDKVQQAPSTSSNKVSEPSSLPSVIPETPGMKGTVLVTDDGEELDGEETILVNVPDDYEPYRPSKRKPRKALFTPTRNYSVSPGSRKRKHKDAAGPVGEVPESPTRAPQGRRSKLSFLIETNNVSERAVSAESASPSKRQRGQPRRRSRLSLQTDMSPEVELEPSQSFSAIGVGDSQESKDVDCLGERNTSSGNEAAEASKVTPSDAIQKQEAVDDYEAEEVITPIRELLHIDSMEDSKEITASAIADTTMDDSDFLDSSAAMRNKSNHEKMDISNLVVQRPTPSVEVLRGASAPVQADSQEGVPTMRSMREKLRGLISELATAVLTREEVNVFEDMFMDAKEKLYGAARRGRAESS